MPKSVFIIYILQFVHILACFHFLFINKEHRAYEWATKQMLFSDKDFSQNETTEVNGFIKAIKRLTHPITMQINITYLAFLLMCYLNLTSAYSASEDARIIAEYQRSLKRNHKPPPSELDHASIARKLVHQTNWASVGTISTNAAIKDFPMVNIISINDNDVNSQSTGRIQFLLSDLDFTGPDWQHNNKVTLLFTDEQQLHCTKNWPNTVDPMEPTCPRVIISGEVKKVDKNNPEYDENLMAFVYRHPAAKNWLKAHTFYLCELVIKNIFVLDFYGGPHTVKPEDYFNAKI